AVENQVASRRRAQHKIGGVDIERIGQRTRAGVSRAEDHAGIVEPQNAHSDSRVATDGQSPGIKPRCGGAWRASAQRSLSTIRAVVSIVAGQSEDVSAGLEQTAAA